MKLKICVGCGRLKEQSPCVGCSGEYQRRRDARRGNSSQRGYGYAHRRNSAHVGVGSTHCPRCGSTYTHDNPMTRDHIIPKSKGGMNNKENYQELCRTCNSSKSNHIE
jgi:5-methylcytosine-specific restriction endonuclease McrA